MSALAFPRREGSAAALVGVVTTSYPRGPSDFAGSFVRASVASLVRGGAEVEVVAAGADGDEAGDALPGVRIVRVPFALPSAAPLFYGAGAPEALEAGGAGAALQALHFWGGLVEALRARAGRWVRVESHWLVPCALATALVAGGRPHRAHAHSGDVAWLERVPGGAAIARRIARSGAELVFASAPLRERFAALVGASLVLRADVAPAAVAASFQKRDAASRAAARHALGIDGPIALAVGRLVPVKGFDRLVLAVAHLPPTARPALVVVGEGPERARLEALAARSGVALRLPGALPPEEVARFLHAADLYVQPSRRLSNGRTEGTPVAALEALAVGLPLVVSLSGGLAAIGRGEGRVTMVEPDDAPALARALREALVTRGCADRCALET